MSKRVTRTEQSAAERQAERDALILSAATASTTEDHLSVLSRSAQVEQAERTASEQDALVMVRMRGAAIWGAYATTVASRGGKVETPMATTFAQVRGILGIPDRPKQGATGVPFHGLAYQTLEQAYAYHQFTPEDGYREAAYTRFLERASAEQAAYLGTRPASLIGRLTFARRVRKGEDGIVEPTSGTFAARRDSLCDQVLAAADARITAQSDDARKVADDTRILIDRVDNGTDPSIPLVSGVPGLHALMVSTWSDDQIESVVVALRRLKGRTRPASVTPDTPEQVEQVASLAEQAEQVTPAAPVLTPEQVSALLALAASVTPAS